MHTCTHIHTYTQTDEKHQTNLIVVPHDLEATYKRKIIEMLDDRMNIMALHWNMKIVDTGKTWEQWKKIKYQKWVLLGRAKNQEDQDKEDVFVDI